MKHKAIVIGTSHGGLEALRLILPQFEKGFPLPVLVVLHIGGHNIDIFVEHLNECCQLEVKEAEYNETILPGFIYFAPPNYHLQVESDFTFSLSTAEKLNFSRPSIDVLFESAAWAYTSGLIGVILTGANSDGANGLKVIKDLGGVTIVQDPVTAVSPVMPSVAIQLAPPHFQLEVEEIAKKLNDLALLA